MVAMSQSKTDWTRSGLAGSNWQLSILKSLCSTESAGSRAWSRPVPRPPRRRGRTRRPARPGQQDRRDGMPALLPATSCRSTKPSGRPRSATPACSGSSRCRSARASTTAKPIRRPRRVAGHARRDAAPDHLARAVLDDEEVRAGDRVIVAEQVGARRTVVMPPQPGQRPVLALHVVRADRDLAERRPADDQAAVGELEQVRQVGRAVRELPHRHQRAEPVDVRLQITGEPVPVELVAWPHGPYSGGYSCGSPRTAGLAKRVTSAARRMVPA